MSLDERWLNMCCVLGWCHVKHDLIKDVFRNVFSALFPALCWITEPPLCISMSADREVDAGQQVRERDPRREDVAPARIGTKEEASGRIPRKGRLLRSAAALDRPNLICNLCSLKTALICPPPPPLRTELNAHSEPFSFVFRLTSIA